MWGSSKIWNQTHSGVWSKAAAEEVIRSIGFWGYPGKNQTVNILDITQEEIKDNFEKEG